MANRYLYFNPRGFSNEYSIISVDMKSDAETKILNLFTQYYQYYPEKKWNFITYKEAHSLTAHNRKLLREYRRAGLNNYVGATEITSIKEYNWLLNVDIPL